ncbi:hypothetical protein PS850_04932 [Pseudomonas fluorescens]|nr:hypothetical protein PS850_04932 [Pseudomonas fluorescens]
MNTHDDKKVPRGGIIARIEAIAAKALTKNRTKNLAPPPTSLPKEHQLPYRVENIREVPNIALRSALFGAIGKGNRRYLERERVFSQANSMILYTGVQLDQGDLDLWENLLHIARTQPLGQDCIISTYRLLKLLNKTDTGANRKVLKRRLSRLSASALDIKIENDIYYEGSLINEILRDEISGKSIIRLNPSLSKMFESDQFTRIDWKIRHYLNGKFLAQWLHGYYSSHANPYPVRVETLRLLSGSNSTYLSKFRQQLKDALDTLKEACHAHNELFDYQIQGDLVKIKKSPSKAQLSHLAKRKRDKNTVTAGNSYRRGG